MSFSHPIIGIVSNSVSQLWNVSCTSATPLLSNSSRPVRCSNTRERFATHTRDTSWIHCDAFHVELSVLRAGLQFGVRGRYDARKSGHLGHDVESRRDASFSVLARDFTLPRIANDLFEFRLHERKADPFLAIRCERDSLTIAVSNDEYFFKPMCRGSKVQYALTFAPETFKEEFEDSSVRSLGASFSFPNSLSLVPLFTHYAMNREPCQRSRFQKNIPKVLVRLLTQFSNVREA